MLNETQVLILSEASFSCCSFCFYVFFPSDLRLVEFFAINMYDLSIDLILSIN